MRWLSLTMPTLLSYNPCVESSLSHKCWARYGPPFIYQVTTANLKIDRLPECTWSDLSTACLLAVLAIDLNMVVQPKLKTNLADAVNQKARRRRNTLFKKASEYSSECGADIHLVLRMKKSGKIFILTSNSQDWPLSDSQLVSFSLLYISSL